MIGLAVLDLDGTLVDSAAHCAAIVNVMLADRGSAARVTGNDARRLISGGASGLVAGLLGRDMCDPDRDLVEFRQRYADMPTPAASLFEGVAEGLASLYHAGVRLAVCSNKPQGLCEKVLSDLGLDRYFAAVVGSTPAAPSKPDPSHLVRTLVEAGGENARACYVGDSAIDHAVAAKVGLPFILVTYGYAEPDETFAGAHRADHFAAVAPLVLGLLGELQDGDASLARSARG